MVTLILGDRCRRCLSVDFSGRRNILLLAFLYYFRLEQNNKTMELISPLFHFFRTKYNLVGYQSCKISFLHFFRTRYNPVVFHSYNNSITIKIYSKPILRLHTVNRKSWRYILRKNCTKAENCMEKLRFHNPALSPAWPGRAFSRG